MRVEVNWPCGKFGSLAETVAAKRWIRPKIARPRVLSSRINELLFAALNAGGQSANRQDADAVC
jgi:hypothetical protein